MGHLRVLGWVDPNCDGNFWRLWRLAREPLGRAEKRGVEGCLAGDIDVVRLPEVDLIGGHQADSGVVVVLVIPGEETAAEDAGRVDGLKPFGKFWLIFQGLEMGLPRMGCHSRCVDGCGI